MPHGFPGQCGRPLLPGEFLSVSGREERKITERYFTSCSLYCSLGFLNHYPCPGADDSSSKEEVIYIMAGTDGEVEGRLTAGSAELYDRVVSLCDGAKELNDGTGKLNSETEQMDTKLQDKVDEILSSIEGEKTEPKEPESKTLWQKFVRLFGFCG